jgi:hypothetical protein
MRIPPPLPGRRQDGMAVIAVIAILSIILIFVAGNLRTLHLLRNNLKFIEQQQTNRLAIAGPITNAIPLESKPVSATSNEAGGLKR